MPFLQQQQKDLKTKKEKNRAALKASGGGALPVRMRELRRLSCALRGELWRGAPKAPLPALPRWHRAAGQPLLGPVPSLAAMRAAPPRVQSEAYMCQSYRLTKGESLHFPLLPMKAKAELEQGFKMKDVVDGTGPFTGLQSIPADPAVVVPARVFMHQVATSYPPTVWQFPA